METNVYVYAYNYVHVYLCTHAFLASTGDERERSRSSAVAAFELMCDAPRGRPCKRLYVCRRRLLVTGREIMCARCGDSRGRI